jgi:hypothetical protein
MSKQLIETFGDADNLVTIETVARNVPTSFWEDLTPEQQEWEGEYNEGGYIIYNELVFGLHDIVRLESYGDWEGVCTVTLTTAYVFRYDHDDDTWDIGYLISQ